MEENKSKINFYEEDNEAEDSREQEGRLNLEEEQEEWDIFEEEEEEEYELAEEPTPSDFEPETDHGEKNQGLEGQASSPGPAIRIARATRVRQELIVKYQAQDPERKSKGEEK